MAHLGHLIIFEHSNFDGNHKHVIQSVPNLFTSSGEMNDKLSSLVILDGRWEFFRHSNFVDSLGTLGVGDYANVADTGIPHDQVSSIRLIASS